MEKISLSILAFTIFLLLSQTIIAQDTNQDSEESTNHQNFLRISDILDSAVPDKSERQRILTAYTRDPGIQCAVIVGETMFVALFGLANSSDTNIYLFKSTNPTGGSSSWTNLGAIALGALTNYPPSIYYWADTLFVFFVFTNNSIGFYYVEESGAYGVDTITGITDANGTISVSAFSSNLVLAFPCTNTYIEVVYTSDLSSFYNYSLGSSYPTWTATASNVADSLFYLVRTDPSTGYVYFCQTSDPTSSSGWSQWVAMGSFQTSNAVGVTHNGIFYLGMVGFSNVIQLGVQTQYSPWDYEEPISGWATPTSITMIANSSSNTMYMIFQGEEQDIYIAWLSCNPCYGALGFSHNQIYIP